MDNITLLFNSTIHGRHVSDAKRLVALNKTYLMSSGCLIGDAVSQCSFGCLCVTVINSRSTQ